MKDLFPKNLIARWNEALVSSVRILLATHIYPDGDAVGSLVGLGLFLRQQGFEVSMICPSPYPDFLKFLDKNGEVLFFSHDREQVIRQIAEADVIIAVDVSGFTRMEEMGDLLSASGAFKVLMDHHIDPVEGDFDLVFSTPDVSSTCELIYRVLHSWRPKATLSKEQAIAFLTGIITDTNQFANSIYPETFNVVSALNACGADMEEIFDQVFRNFTYNRMRLMGYALQNIKLLPEFKTGYIVLTRDVLDAFEYKNGDTEGLLIFRLPSRESPFLPSLFRGKTILKSLYVQKAILPLTELQKNSLTEEVISMPLQEKWKINRKKLKHCSGKPWAQ